MSSPYSPSSNSSDNSSEDELGTHYQSDTPDFFLANSAPTADKQRVPKKQHSAALVGTTPTIVQGLPQPTSSWDAAAPADHYASCTPVGSTPNLVHQNAPQLMEVFEGLHRSVAILSEQLSQPSASQEVQQSTETLSVSSPSKSGTNPTNKQFNLFDPSGLVEKRYFAGAPDTLCTYLTKHFSQPLNSEHRTEMAKKYKRPDIPAMQVQKLDSFFLRKKTIG